MNRISNVCFVCDHVTKPLSGNESFNQKSCIFQKLNIKISNKETDVMDVVCGNCTVILEEIDALRSEMNLLSYLVHRQIRRKYKVACCGLGEQPKIDLLNKLDLMAVKSFKLLSNDYVCMKCSFRTPFQDTLVPHYKFHMLCEKLQKSEKIEAVTVACEDDLIEYNSDYEDELDDGGNVKSSESVKYAGLNPPESQKIELEFMCPWCIFKDSEYDNLARHINEMHPDGEKKKINSCHNCGCLLGPNGSCTHQKAIENGFKPKNCSKCHEIFYMDHLLHDHFRRIHLKCNICGKGFSNFKTLRHHEYNHKNGEMYKCCDCDKKFKTRSGLTYHLPKHTGNYLYYCNVCSKGFMSEKFMEEHMGVHTKIQKYVCDICDTKFIHNSTYRLHRLWHDNPFPYECNECGKKFKHTSNLAVHRRREHTGERPYKCDVCQKTFFETTSLKTHQRIHAQVVTYKCLTCNVSFNSKPEYIQHMQQTHSRHSNLPKKKTCEYKVVLKPEYTAHHKTEPWQVADDFNANKSFEDNLIEEISNDYSNLDDSFIYKILL